MIQRQEIPLLLTGFMATLSGVGLARFAYTALMPQMVHAGWFSGEQVAYLGAANLLGYLIGALAAAPLAERMGALSVLVACWVAVMLSFAACSLPQPMALFFVWRLISGIAGAALMVLGPSVAMSAAAPQRRATLGPLMFCGIGCGALLSATLVPLIGSWSLSAVWWSLAISASIAGWLGLRQAQRLAMLTAPLAPITPASQTSSAANAPPGLTTGLWTTAVLLLFLGYMCDAFGYVPHTVFWVDYLAREQQLGATYASAQWAIFGLGALLGPLAVALAATRWGWWAACTGTYATKTVGVALPLFWASFSGHALSSLLVGALSPGLSAVTSGYLMQLVGATRHKRMWGYATAAFALMQALAGYWMAWIYAQLGAYQPLFVMGAMALICGTALIASSRFGSQLSIVHRKLS